ncbi:MAG: response regulator [Coleofasciculaceae cyanobacterium]
MKYFLPHPVTPSPRHPFICFEVEDTGLGIAQEELEQLFTAFGQTETGRQSQQGTGLGLAISQKFVQLMGGKITVNSTLGQGTTFAFQIPVNLAEASEVQTTQVTRRVIGLAPEQPIYRVLVVEDRPNNRLLLVQLLTSLGFSVYEAANGQEAIDKWLSHSPQLILMDMRMPVMNGYEASRQIRALESRQFYRQAEEEEPSSVRKATTIIALTSSVFTYEQSLVLSAGCNDLVHKPFREELLLEKIAKNLDIYYLYEESDVVKEKTQVSGDNSASNYKSLNWYLSRMPKEWLEKLNEAAIKGLDQEIMRLCTQIPRAYTPLDSALKDWADNFLFDQVIELIQQVQIEA